MLWPLPRADLRALPAGSNKPTALGPPVLFPKGAAVNSSHCLRRRPVAGTLRRRLMPPPLGAVPHLPFDGAWNRDKRDRLRVALLFYETVLPGTRSLIVGAELIVPPQHPEPAWCSGAAI